MGFQAGFEHLDPFDVVMFAMAEFELGIGASPFIPGIISPIRWRRCANALPSRPGAETLSMRSPVLPLLRIEVGTTFALLLTVAITATPL